MRLGSLPGRWLASLGLAALGHGALLLAGLSWAASPPSSSGAPVFAVEIAAAPQPVPPQPVVQPEPPPTPTVAEVPLPRPKPPPPKPKPKPVAAAKPVPPADAVPPPSVPANAAPAPEPEAKAAAAPVPGANAQASLARATSWQGELLGRLESFKRYPRSAQWKRRQGTAIVAFGIDRNGRVLDKRLNRSSGHDDLDAEALDLLDRAQPLPPPPDSIPGARVELVVPIQFSLKR